MEQGPQGGRGWPQGHRWGASIHRGGMSSSISSRGPQRMEEHSCTTLPSNSPTPTTQPLWEASDQNSGSAQQQPWGLLDTHILTPHPRPAESECRGRSPETGVLRSPGNSGAHWSLRPGTRTATLNSAAHYDPPEEVLSADAQASPIDSDSTSVSIECLSPGAPAAP